MRPTWLKWIDPEDSDQLAWVGQYLARRGYSELVPANEYPPDGKLLIQTMANREHDQHFRYKIVQEMRSAWRQKQYRARNGNQVCFQLSKQVRTDLARLAKASGQNKVETLRQMISDAAGQHDTERSEIKDLKDKRKKEKALYHQIIDRLLEALAGELEERKRLEKQKVLDDVGEELTLDVVRNTQKRIDERIKSRIEAIESQIPELKAMHLPRGSLRKRLQPDNAPKI